MYGLIKVGKFAPKPFLFRENTAVKQCFTYYYTVSATDRELKLARDNLFVNEVLPPINTSNQMPILAINRFFPGTYIHLLRKIDKKNYIGILILFFGFMFIFWKKLRLDNFVSRSTDLY